MHFESGRLFVILTLLAAFTASSTSSFWASATSTSFAPVLGSSVPKTFPDLASTNLPSINSCKIRKTIMGRWGQDIPLTSSSPLACPSEKFISMIRCQQLPSLEESQAWTCTKHSYVFLNLCMVLARFETISTENLVIAEYPAALGARQQYKLPDRECEQDGCPMKAERQAGFDLGLDFAQDILQLCRKVCLCAFQGGSIDWALLCTGQDLCNPLPALPWG